MTLDAAIAEARAIQFEADNDWPYGYDRDAFEARTTPMLRAFDDYLAGIPVGEQRTAAYHRLMARIEGREYRASVPPRRERRM